TFRDRAKKWARRHKAVVASAAVLVLLALVVSGVGTVLIWREKERAQGALAQAEVERRRAEVRYRLVRLAPNDIYTDVIQNWLAQTDVARKWLTQEAHQAVQRELLLQALAYYQELTRELDSDAEARLEKAMAHRRVGEVQQQLGRPREAEEAYRRALTLFENLAANSPEVPDHGWILAACLDKLGRLLAADPHRLPEAEQVFRRALTLGERLMA